MKNSPRSIIAALLVIVIVVLAIGVGVSVYTKNMHTDVADITPLATTTDTSTENSAQEDTDINSTSSTSVTSASSTIITVDTSNWKTFRDDKYGFEFKYPASLGKVVAQPLKYQSKIDCSPSSGYDQVIATESIEGLGVQISCDYHFENTASTYIQDHYSGGGDYEVINTNGQKSYFFDYTSGVGYNNKELYISFLNGFYVLLGQSSKAGRPSDYPELTIEQFKGIASTFKVTTKSGVLYVPPKYTE